MSTPFTVDEKLAALCDDVNRLRTEIVESRATVAELRDTVAELRDALDCRGQPPSSSMENSDEAAVTSRRGMLKKVGAIAAGVAAAGLLRPSQGDAAIHSHNTHPLPYATGGNFILGAINSASGTDNTVIVNPNRTTPSPAVFAAVNYGNVFAASPPAGNLTSGYLYANNSGGFSDGNLHALYAVALTPAGGLGTGVYAEGDYRGLHAVGGINGDGVFAVCNGGEASFAVRGSSDLGIGGVFNGAIGVYARGTRAALTIGHLIGNPNFSSVSHTLGDIVPEVSGDLWHCVTEGIGNADARFRKLSGPGTAGAAHILATPIRYVDTRNGTGGFNTPFANGTVRSFDFDALQSGTIPVRARGIFGNLTAASPGGNGNFQTNAVNSFPAGSAAVMSFTPGVNLSNHFVSALSDTGQMFVRANVVNGTGQVHLVLDVQGYYL